MNYNPASEIHHLVIADDPPGPEAKTLRDFVTRDVSDEALCGWRLPHKWFGRILLSERRGWEEICPECLQAIPEDWLIAMCPPEDWVPWDEAD